MHFHILAVTAFAAGALAQTPPDTSPSASASLPVQFGSSSVSPGALIPTSVAASQPLVSSSTQYPGTYQLFMLDLSIKFSQVISDSSNTSAISTLTPGIGAGNTTRLHWWSSSVTQAPNGTFYKTTDNALEPAPYNGPKPPVGSEPHTYVIYLFHQISNYSFPAAATSGTYSSVSTARMNFSLADTVAQVGMPVAANYYTAVAATNASGNGSATGTGMAGGPTTSAATGAPIGTGLGARFGVDSTLAALGALVFAMLV